MLYHHYGPYFMTTQRPRLITTLECRGWRRTSARGHLCRMVRNEESITIGQCGTVVADGLTAEAVLHELTRTEVLPW